MHDSRENEFPLLTLVWLTAHDTSLHTLLKMRSRFPSLLPVEAAFLPPFFGIWWNDIFFLRRNKYIFLFPSWVKRSIFPSPLGLWNRIFILPSPERAESRGFSSSSSFSSSPGNAKTGFPRSRGSVNTAVVWALKLTIDEAASCLLPAYTEPDGEWPLVFHRASRGAYSTEITFLGWLPKLLMDISPTSLSLSLIPRIPLDVYMPVFTSFFDKCLLSCLLAHHRMITSYYFNLFKCLWLCQWRAMNYIRRLLSQISVKHHRLPR